MGNIECRIRRLDYDLTRAMLRKFPVRGGGGVGLNRILRCQNPIIGLAIESKHFVAPPIHWVAGIHGAARKLNPVTDNLRHKPFGSSIA